LFSPFTNHNSTSSQVVEGEGEYREEEKWGKKNPRVDGGGGEGEEEHRGWKAMTRYLAKATTTTGKEGEKREGAHDSGGGGLSSEVGGGVEARWRGEGGRPAAASGLDRETKVASALGLIPATKTTKRFE
jgi:hypothetical protein